MSHGDLIRRYFAALDAGDAADIPALFAEDCRIFRPERDEPLIGASMVERIVSMRSRVYSRMETTLLDLLEQDDTVVVRLRHDAVHAGSWNTRIGRFELAGQPVSWEAMALFRIEDGRIAEERVFRDELGMLLRVGAIEAAEPSA